MTTDPPTTHAAADRLAPTRTPRALDPDSTRRLVDLSVIAASLLGFAAATLVVFSPAPPEPTAPSAPRSGDAPSLAAAPAPGLVRAPAPRRRVVVRRSRAS